MEHRGVPGHDRFAPQGSSDLDARDPGLDSRASKCIHESRLDVAGIRAHERATGVGEGQSDPATLSTDRSRLDERQSGCEPAVRVEQADYEGRVAVAVRQEARPVRAVKGERALVAFDEIDPACVIDGEPHWLQGIMPPDRRRIGQGEICHSQAAAADAGSSTRAPSSSSERSTASIIRTRRVPPRATIVAEYPSRIAAQKSASSSKSGSVTSTCFEMMSPVR